VCTMWWVISAPSWREPTSPMFIDGLPFSARSAARAVAVNANRENRCLCACSPGRKFTMLAVIHSGTPSVGPGPDVFFAYMNWSKVIDQVATWRRFKAVPGEYLTNLIGLLGRTPPAALADRRTGLIANDRYHGVNQSGVNVGYTRLGIDDIHIVFLPPNGSPRCAGCVDRLSCRVHLHSLRPARPQIDALVASLNGLPWRFLVITRFSRTHAARTALSSLAPVTNFGASDKSADGVKDPPRREVQIGCCERGCERDDVGPPDEGLNRRRVTTRTLPRHDAGVH